MSDKECRYKFRAWDKENKEMVEVELLGKGVLLIKDGEWENIENFEVMQYTGLKDRNGREIYEGDIIKARDVKVNGQDKFYICEVKWMPTGWYAMSYKDLVGTEHFLSLNILETEVIGNIYENPELLEDPK